jgi:deoxyribose-phosphate aldolase
MTIASLIDHTLLKPAATSQQIAQLCQEALDYQFASVCVNPVHVKQVAAALNGSKVKVCTVVGFPLGATTSAVKAFETAQVIGQGATEVDMVINVGALKDHDDDLVKRDIEAVVEVAHQQSAICKVIIETALLTDDEKVRACQLAQQAGADFVKTSTGFAGGGATVEDVTLMRRTVGPDMGVKASGGIGSLVDAQKMIDAGATRLGASAGVKIIEEALAS